MAARWILTVPSLICSSRAMSLFGRPFASSFRTSIWRSVSTVARRSFVVSPSLPCDSAKVGATVAAADLIASGGT